MSEALLQDRRVLVVEDEYVIAETVSRNLRDAGATVIGPASDVEGALALLREHDVVDAAVLDINLGETKVYPCPPARSRPPPARHRLRLAKRSATPLVDQAAGNVMSARHIAEP